MSRHPPAPAAAIVVTGAGVVTPVARNRRDFAAALAGVTEGETLASAKPRTTIDAFETAGLPEPKSLRRAAPHVLFGLAAACEALAGTGDGVAPEESALVFASTLGSTNFSYRLWQELVKSGPLGASPVLFSEGVPNALAGHVARALRLLGAGHMVGGGSDGGLRSVAIARDLLDRGRARRVVVGAAEESSELSQRAYARFRFARDPAKGERARGAFLSEGAAALCFEHAHEARAPALATLAAVESVQLPSLRGDAAVGELAALFQRTFEAAGVRAADAWLASAANGTPADRLEATTLARLDATGAAPRRGRSIRVRVLCGEAFCVTPLLQMVEALAVAAEGGVAAVLSLSPFAGATLALLTPPTRPAA